MKKNFLQKRVKKTSWAMLFALIYFIFSPTLGAQTEYRSDNHNLLVGTSDSRLAATVIETDAEVEMKVFFIGDVSVDAMSFAIFFDTEALSLYDKANEVEITAPSVITDDYKDKAIVMSADAVAHNFEYGLVSLKRNGTILSNSGHASMWAFYADVNISGIEPTDPDTYYTLEEGYVGEIFTVYFKKKSAGVPLTTDDFGIGYKSTNLIYAAGWGIDEYRLGYGIISDEINVAVPAQILYRSPSSVATDEATDVAITSAVLNGNFAQWKIQPAEDLVDGATTTTGKLHGDQISQRGFIYSTNNVAFLTSDLSDKMKVGTEIYDMPTSDEMTAGTFTRGDHTFFITYEAGSGDADDYDLSVSGLSSFTTYYYQAFINYVFETSNTFISVGELKNFTTVVDCIPIVAGSISVETQPTCGAADGSIKIYVSGGNGDLEFSLNGETAWAALPANGIIENLTSGTYRVHLRSEDFPECGVSISNPVTLNDGGNNLDLLVSINNATACGTDDGSLVLYITGGTAPYQYSLNDGSMTAVPANNTLDGLTPGIYTVDIKDADGCTISSGEMILKAADGGLTVVASGNTSTTCDDANGSFTLTFNGGTAPFSYQINSGILQTTSENSVAISGLSAGFYTWRVTDASGCYAEGNETVTNSDNNNFAFALTTGDASCAGTADGSIALSITGGTAPFEYSYDGGATWTSFTGTTVTIGGLAPGSYNVVVKDAAECTFSYQDARISDDAPIDLIVGTISIVQQPTCGNEDGIISLEVSGGSGNYQFALNDSNDFEDLDTSENIEGLAAGTYRIRIRDREALACGTVVSEPITLYPMNTDLAISVTAQNASDCGVNDGFLTVETSGGSGSYSYTLNGEPTTPVGNKIENLFPGIYSVSVTDAAGCTVSSEEVEIVGGDNGLIVVLSDNQPSICAAATGSFKLTIQNGTPPYTYQIDGGAIQRTLENVIVVSNLNAGHHVWEIIDASGCHAYDSNTIESDDSDFMFAIETEKAFCDGMGGGRITITIENGTAPYNYSSDNGENWASTSSNPIILDDLSQGNYDVIVRNSDNCLYEYQNIIIERGDNSNLGIGTIYIAEQPTCGEEDGSIYVSVFGGSESYEYQVNGNAPYRDFPADGIISDLSAGTYQIYVRDKSFPNCGIAISEPITLRASDSDLDLNVTINNATACGTNNGSLLLTITGGTAPYQYSLNDGPLSDIPANNTIAGLNAGEYKVDITDAEGCVVSSGIVVIGTIDAGLDAEATVIAQATCEIALGAFSITVDGTAPYQYQINGGTIQEFTGSSVTITGLSAGSHTWRVTDADGCFAEGRETIENSGTNDFSFVLTTTDASCEGTSGGTITLTMTGDNTPFSYSFDNGENWESFTGNTVTIPDLAQGSYYVSAKDNAGCVYKYYDAKIERSSDTDLTAGTIQIVAQPTCGELDGSIRIMVSGADAYQYSLNGTTPWADLASDGLIENLAAGTYRVYVRSKDFPYCGEAISAPVTLVNKDSGLELNLISNNASDCGVDDGSLEIYPSNGTPPYQYSLNGGAMADIPADNTIGQLTPGIYVVDVIDADGCLVSSGEVLLEADDAGLDVVISANVSALCGNTNGGFTITVNGGTSPYQYQINGGVLQTISGNSVIIAGLSAGNHVWRVVDAEGCYAEDREVIVNSDNENYAFTVNANNLGCDETSLGSINISVTGGTAPFAYSYDNGVNWVTFSTVNTTISNLLQGSYNVMVKDASDCVYTYQDIRIGKDNTSNLMVGTISVQSQPTCADDTGSVQVYVTGGSGSYQYALNGVGGYKDLAANGIIEDLGAGTYKIYIQDKAAPTCGTVVSPAITLRPMDTDLSLMVVATDATGCGVEDGKLTVVASGGQPDYSYTVNGVPMTPDANGIINGLTSGVYVVDVTDEAGCLVSGGEVWIKAGTSGLLVTASGETNTNCGATIGSFILTATGGTSPYVWQLDGGATTTTTTNTITFSNLLAGNYTWKVTDAAGCYAEGRQVVKNGDAESYAVTTTTTDASCDGTSGGTISLTITGGTAPYQYSYDGRRTWHNLTGAAGVIENLAAGSYDIIVKDANNCEFMYDDAVIHRGVDSDLDIKAVYIVSQPNCGTNTGSVYMEIVGGSGSYRYRVNGEGAYKDFPSDGIITGLYSGTYRFYVEDKDAPACGTAISQAITLTPTNTDLAITVTTTDASECGVADGALIVAATGGNLDYTFTVNGATMTPDADGVISGLTSGVYVVDVTDEDNCLVSNGEVWIKAGENGLDITVDIIAQPLCEEAKGALALTVAGGSAPYTWQLNSGTVRTTMDATVMFSGLAAGNYFWQVVDATGCYAEGRFVITNSDNQDFVVEATAVDALCDGLNSGSIVLTATGGAQPYQYSRDNGDNWYSFESANTTTIYDLAIGTYSVVVRDADNCEFSYETITIGHSLIITPPTVTTPQTFCSGATVADLKAQGSGIKWYADATGGTPLSEGEALEDGKIYYAAQSSNICESVVRSAVKVIIDNDVILDAPRMVSPQTLCAPATLADVALYGDVTNVVWYENSTGGDRLPLTTPLEDGKSYYAAQVAGGSCESALRTEVEIVLQSEPAAKPDMVTPQYFCEGATVANLEVPNNQIVWYADATGGTALLGSTSLVNGKIYYAAQKTGSCQSAERTAVTVYLTAPKAPKAQEEQSICSGLETLADLQITGSGIVWYDAENGGTKLPLDTTLEDGETYWAAQSSNGCEGERIGITINNTCYTVSGTVFPFVYEEDNPEHNALFPIMAKLFAVPDGTTDPLNEVLFGTPLYITTAVFYNGDEIFVPGTPKNPGQISRTNNPGHPIDWSIVGKTQGAIDETTLTGLGDKPTSNIGVYTFENAAAGTYILELSRNGFLIRWGKITIADDSPLGHRELLAGDVNNDLMVNSYDISKINPRSAMSGTSLYEAKYDFNGDGYIDANDNSIIIFDMSTSIELYNETLEWLMSY